MLEIIKLPNPKLRQRSTEVGCDFLLSAKTQKLIKDMIPAMYAAEGVGLAAVQIGHNIRVCVINKQAIPAKHSLKQKDLVLVNPVWTKTSRKTETKVEGCLSAPKKYGKVKRYKNIKVTALDVAGNPLSFNAVDLFARVIQHEVDHLDGILFIDKAKDIYLVE